MILLIVAVAAAVASPAPPPSPSPAPLAADLELVDEVRDIAARLELVRGARPPAIPVPSRAGAEARAALAAEAVGRYLPASRLEARGRAWASLGFGDGRTPASLADRLAADLDGIALDPGGRRLLVDPARLTSKDFGPTEGPEDTGMTVLLATGVRPDEPVVAHLLVHAITSARGTPVPATTDALLARAAWTEGEANLAAILYLFRGMGLDKEVLAGHMDPQRVLGGRLVPGGIEGSGEIEKSFLDFVYLEGLAQARERLARGGWRALEEASRSRGTTRDVLHAERPPIALAAFDTPHPPDGFAVADTDSLGEQGIVTLVSVLTGKDNLGLQSGDGWMGDALFRLEPAAKPSDGYTIWESAWTGEDRAKDFLYGFRRTLEARYPDRTVQPGAAGGFILIAPDAVYRVTPSGARVTVRVAPPAIDSRLEKPTSHAPARPKR